VHWKLCILLIGLYGYVIFGLFPLSTVEFVCILTFHTHCHCVILYRLFSIPMYPCKMFDLLFSLYPCMCGFCILTFSLYPRCHCVILYRLFSIHLYPCKMFDLLVSLYCCMIMVLYIWFKGEFKFKRQGK